jgi:hypothetical protein
MVVRARLRSNMSGQAERNRIITILEKQPDEVWRDLTGVIVWLDAGAPDVPDIYGMES